MDAQTLTSQSIPILIRNLAIPASMGMVFNTLYNIVDTYYAGLISTQALAALASSSFLFFFIIALGYGASSALTALIGHAYGRKHSFLAQITTQKGIALVSFLGIFLSILGYTNASWLLKLSGSQEAYHDLALAYMQIILAGAVFFFLNFAFNSILVATGDTKSYRNTLIFGFFANLVLNPLFIYGWLFIPSFGVSGIALSTVLIQAINALYLLKKCHQTGLLLFTCKNHFYPHLKLYKEFFTQALPPALNMLMISLGSLIALHFVSHYGENAVADFGIGYRVEQLMLLPSLGISSAVLSLVSNNAGAKEFTRVRQTLLYALGYGYFVSFFGMLFLLFLGEWIVGLFAKDALVLSFAKSYIGVMIFLFYGYLTHFVCVSTLQGLKKPTMIFYIGFFRQILAPIIAYTLCVSYFELSFISMWIALGGIVYSSAAFLLLYTYRQLSIKAKLSAQIAKP